MKIADILAANGGELPPLAGGATEKVIYRESKKLKAGEEWLEKQFFLVTLNTSDTLELAVSGSIAYPLIDTPKEGEFGTFAILGTAKVICGGAIEAGKRVAANNKGEAQEWASGQFAVGVALEKGEAKQYISIAMPAPPKA